MKKTIKVVLTCLLAMTLFGCSNSDDNNSTVIVPNKNEVKINLEQEYANDNASISLFKIQTTNKIEASMGNGLYYENDKSNETYIDVVLDYTNLSANSINSEDALEVKAVIADGTEYYSNLYVVEKDNNTYVSAYETIEPLAIARLHAAISVPNTLEDVKVVIKLGKDSYYYDYKLSTIEKIENLIVENQKIGDENYAEVVFKGITYSDVLNPSNTSGFYTYYDVDDSSNTYLIAKFEITNYQSNAKDADTFVSVKAKYLNKYNYNGFIVVEDLDKKGFSAYEDLSPLTTRKVYYLIEVPKTVVDKECEITIFFNNMEYTYKK